MRSVERFVSAVVIAAALAVCLGCGGGGGGPADTIPPTITSVTVSPTVLQHQGGQVTVTVVASDTATSAAALRVSASLVEPSSGDVVVGPKTLPLISGTTYRASLTAPANTTSAAQTYTVRVRVLDGAGNEATDETQSISVNGLNPPTITSVGVSPATFDYHGGSATVTVVASDDTTAPAAMEVLASLIEPGSGAVVSGPVVLAFVSGNTFRGPLDVPPDASAQARTYKVRASVRDADDNVTVNETKSVSVGGLTPPPPPPS